VQENDSFVVTLPATLDSAIQLLVPGFRLRTKAEVELVGFAIRAEPNHSIVAIATDLDGDGKLEAVLWGVLKGRDSLEAADTHGGDGPLRVIQKGIRQRGVILGVRQSATGFLVTKLLAGDEPLFSEDKILREDMLLPSGKSPATKQKAGLVHWIRWQDYSNCGLIGHQWTVRNRVWIHSTPDCSEVD
jgi:hypothetical protein